MASCGSCGFEDSQYFNGIASSLTPNGYCALVKDQGRATSVLKILDVVTRESRDTVEHTSSADLVSYDGP
jgi:hypothetical protein